MVFELLAVGDYLDTHTNSLSLFGKVIVAFGAVIGLTGCKGDETPAAAPLSADLAVDPYTTATADRPVDPQAMVKDGVWDASTMSIAFTGRETRIWTSFTKAYSAQQGEIVTGVEGNPAQIWLSDSEGKV